jgi:hypothetical protein
MHIPQHKSQAPSPPPPPAELADFQTPDILRIIYVGRGDISQDSRLKEKKTPCTPGPGFSSQNQRRKYRSSWGGSHRGLNQSWPQNCTHWGLTRTIISHPTFSSKFWQETRSRIEIKSLVRYYNPFILPGHFWPFLITISSLPQILLEFF